MVSRPHDPDDPQDLRRCVRELTGLSTLSAAWIREDEHEIALQLSRALARSLDAELVYVRIGPSWDPAAVELAATARGPLGPDSIREVARALGPVLGGADAASVANPLGRGTVRLAIARIAGEGDRGVVAAASPRPDFPTSSDRLLLGVAVDQAATVLQRRRSEAALRRSEEELADFFENATVGLHCVGPDGTILRANRAELEMLGYSHDEYVGRPIAEFHADADVIDGLLQRLWAGEAVHGFWARMRCKDGALKHVLIDSSVRWEDGRFVHTRCFTRDMTEQKLAQEARLRLAAIVESSDDAIISQDLAGTITSWNRGAERLYGYAAEEVVGLPVSLLIPEDHIDDFRTILERLRRGERIEHYETVRIAKDGRRVEVSLTVSPLRDADGTVVGASKIARDITLRKRTGQALQRQTERLRLLWEAAAVLLTADGREAMLRGVLARIGPHLGVDTCLNYMLQEGGDALTLDSYQGITFEASRAIARLELGQSVCGTVAQQRKPVVAGHIQHSSDPKLQMLRSLGLRAYACNPLLAGGRLLGTLSFGSRVRDQFDAEEVAFMETVCYYMTVACERLRLLDELKDADHRKNEFLATLAHELRNPLAPVRNAVQVLRLKGPDQPELRWARDVIDRQIEYLTRLIDDLMDVSRITRNKLELRRQRIALADVVNGAVESSRPAIEQCGHELVVSLPAEPIHLSGDLVRLAQVFLNLLNNAAKYTEPGGRIRLTAERHGGEVVVRLEDTGLGIPPEKLPQVFDMFFQVDRSLERSQGGLGIGLSLVRRLVELHGGRIEARSEGLGKGSEFVVTLPVLAESSAAVRPEGPRVGLHEGPSARRILVVDDNRDSADSLTLLLRLIGNEVCTAYDGVEAVDLAEHFRPHAVLLDIGMPRLSGDEACRRMRAQGWSNGVLMVALTGGGQDEDRRRTTEAGFDAHLVKPVEPAELLQLLAEPRRTTA
jgi:PAS domain S-box-containing protein